MNKKSLLVFFCLLHSFISLTQNDKLPVYEINADTSVSKIPNAYWQMLVDTNEKWTIADVQSPALLAKFNTNNTEATGIGFEGIHTYWQRLRLKNNTGKELKLIFSNIPDADRYDLFVFRLAKQTEHLVSGNFVPFSQRDGFKSKLAVPLLLSSGEEVTIFKKSFVNGWWNPDGLSIGFSSYESFIQQEYISESKYNGDVRNWLIAGILFFGFVLNFFFFLINKDKVYLYLSLLLLLEGFWYMELNKTITFREFPYFKFYFNTFVNGLLFWIFVTQFVRHFLKTRQHFPKWDKTLVLLTVVTTFFLLFQFYGKDFMTKSTLPIYEFAFSISFMLLGIVQLLSFIFCRTEKDRLTNLSIVAAIPIFLLWNTGYGFIGIYSRIIRNFNLSQPAFMQWYYEWSNVIEMYCMVWFAILFTWILLQRYALLRKQLTLQALEREKEKGEILTQQKELLEAQVEQRTAELKHSLEDLKSTQTQLVQQEKLASLGALTAGIAHEIKNPLNFVNNFSELSTELVDEFIQTKDESERLEIGADLKINLQKINEHGKRADSIVKNMLQHSRSGSGEKQLSDINQLCEEYFNLAFHGKRATDAGFNCEMVKKLENNLPQFNCVVQDISRVILNLINNAFDAVREREVEGKTPNYKPTVSVTTHHLNNNISISISDNGKGIPQHIKEKIFEPFFTTKPAGQGTGLGLSLSYDIVKAHGGEMSVRTPSEKLETKEGEGTEFVILLPL